MRRSLGDIGIFLLSPFLSFPFILKGIYEKRVESVYLFAIMLGIISYLFIPLTSNDKATYFSLYNDFITYDFDYFLHYLSQNVDFVFYTLIFIFSQFGISLDLLFFLITTYTCISIFHYFNFKINKDEVSNRTFLILFFGLFFSISLPNLLLGVRFYLSLAFIFNSIICAEKKRSFRSILFLLLAVSTHFACLLFLPVFFVLKIFPKQFSFYSWFFFSSFLFIFIPIHSLVENLPFFSHSESFSHKSKAYLSEGKNLTEILSLGNLNNTILYVFTNIWLYFAYIYILCTIKRRNSMRPSLLFIFGWVNIFYNFPIVFNRYLLLIQVLFFVMVCYEMTLNQITFSTVKKYIFIIFVSFLLVVYSIREQIYESLWTTDAVSLLTIVIKDPIQISDFIWKRE